uniref:Ribosomal protein rpL28 n=1 Tax=Bigelowiella natans TaxID=227086 RepID=Q7XYN6_BIGNA|nr:ribosomal protein rpL28 [Bigelowiella natans]|mmetsp:Transcript_15144/g.18171  ORF Transcript_15144/g.18171 Transcript_15144/m.18171 type:complete len:242 (+) Transcript_15144:39-764(+)|eukprot:jgi/Bigna1/90102/estExt_fgenesh1_pg.C_620059
MMGRSSSFAMKSSLLLNALLALIALGALVSFRTSTTGGENLEAVMSTISRNVAVNGRRNQIASGRRCGLTGKSGTTAYKYCFSHKRATKRQHPNIQQKYVFWPEGQRMVKIKLSTSALKSIDKKGLQVMAKEAGIDLNKLPFKDMRPERQEYKEKHKMEVPVSKKWVSGYYKKQHRMKNAEKLAASKKTPLEGKYYHGRVLFGRFNEDQMRQINDVPLEDTAEKVYEEGLEVEDTSAPASA